MAGFTAIADIGQTLRVLLEDDLKAELGLNNLTVTLESPKTIAKNNQGQNNLLSVFLYRILENADLRNRQPVTIDVSTEQPTPLAYDLYYMLTPYGTNEETRHRIIGRAVQFLYENAILQGSLLRGGLEGSIDKIRISYLPLSQDAVSQIWQALTVATQLSAFYLVTPVFIESEEVATAARVRERILEDRS